MIDPGNLCALRRACPVWFGEALNSNRGQSYVVSAGTICLVVENDEIEEAPGRSYERWIRAIFPKGIGWISANDLKKID